ncbi:MAG: calcineurin-like phosphoesterase family protein [Bacteroidales bacterium]|nr:calcineurin-like phosphoesterase family protein [Bacteroidales bacterium]
MNRRKFLLYLFLYWIGIVNILVGCGKKEDDIPEEKPDDNGNNNGNNNGTGEEKLIENASIPSSLNVTAGDSLTVNGVGFLAGDKIKITLSLDGRQNYLCEVTAVTPNSATITVPDMDSGRYNFVLVRGDKTAPIGTSTLTVTFTDCHGRITDTGGNPVQGVVVSDGYSCVRTNADGRWNLTKHDNAKFIFYSVPETHEVNVAAGSNAALFYASIDNPTQFNFTLKPLPAVENEFTLLAIGDPQVASAADVTRFTNETMADLKTLINASDKPCYGLYMGDMVADHPELFAQMKNVTGSSKMIYFTTIGNHDKTGGSASVPRNADQFCSVFGPLDYSFNRGNIHFVCLDNVIYTNKDTYTAGFEDRQIEWLRQDLSFVPKSKTVIVYYHIPIRNSNYKNRTALLNLLKPFAKAHLMCGHTHYTEHFDITSPLTVHEFIHAAACGAWWKSTVNGDGTPNGYAVYDVVGSELDNWYYKSTRYSKNFQIRMHWGDDAFGGSHGTFSYGQGHKIVANVFNADAGWTVKAYEDNVFAGNLVKIATTKDEWARGYHIGVLNRNPDNYSPNNKHAYLHTLVNPAATTIEIRATDRFGTVYSQTEIIRNLTTAASYQ